MPPRDTAAARLGQLLVALDRTRLPAHITPAARQMLRPIADRLALPQRIALRALLLPALTETMLRLLGNQAKDLRATPT